MSDGVDDYVCGSTESAVGEASDDAPSVESAAADGGDASAESSSGSVVEAVVAY